jgi:hypothetical protein
MRKLFIVLVAIAAMGLATIAPAGADGAQSVPYTCPVTEGPFAPLNLQADVPITTADSQDPVDIFEPVTFTATVDLPPVDPPIDVTFDRFEIELDVPDGYRAVSANVSNPTSGPVANPPVNQIATVVTNDSITVELPSDPNQHFGNRIRAHDEGTGLTYPANAFNSAINGDPVVPPVVTIEAMPTFARGGETLEWLPPEVRTFVDQAAANVTCTADAPAPIILSTDITPTVNIPDNGYSDTPANHFSDPGIDWGKHMGIIVANFTANRFLPNDPVNRGQIVNMLWNMMDRPPPAGQHPFNDIPANAFYETALDWAFSAGLVTGFAGNKYKPKDPVNRQQLMQMLYQMVDAGSGGPYPADDYTDGPTNAFFQPPMNWADELDLINEFAPSSPPGAEGTTVKPKQAAKRSEVAFILRRVAETDTWFVPLPSTVLHEPT